MLMLGDTAPTSKPRPPAQLKKLALTKTTTSPQPSPLPFTSSPTSSAFASKGSWGHVLSSQFSAVLQAVAQGAHEESSSDSRVHSDLRGRLKDDELSELFVKADKVTKRREIDLDGTNSLRGHKALASRLPNISSPGPLPPASSTSSIISSRRRSSSESINSSRIRTPSTSSSEYPSRSTSLRKRRLTAKPYDISLLREQNEELLLKMVELEAESTSREMADKKMLRNLEKENKGLRAELEALREKEASDAAQAKEITGMGKEDPREKRKMMLRRGAGSIRTKDRNALEAFTMDFAPPGPLLGLSNRARNALHTSISTEGNPSGTPPSSNALEEEQREFIAQLLSKMADLEETNAQLQSQQAETAAQLRAVQKETESLESAFGGPGSLISAGAGASGADYLVEVDPLLQQGNEAVNFDAALKSRESTIRFRTLRRARQSLSSIFPVDASGTPDTNSIHLHTYKWRKSVVGLFEETPPAPPIGQMISVADIFTSSPFFTSSGFGGEPEPLDTPSHIGRSSLPIDPLSTELDLAAAPSFAYDGPSDHLRTSSLFDLFSSSDHGDAASLVGSGEDAIPAPEGWELKTLGRTAGLQLAHEPPTSQFDECRPQSQTTRIRTARWVEGRSADEMISPSTPGTVRGDRLPMSGEDEEDLAGEVDFEDTQSVELSISDWDLSSVGSSKTARSAPVQSGRSRFTTVLNTLVEIIAGRSASGSDSRDPCSVEEWFGAPASPIREKKPARVWGVILNVWLWLRFAGVISMFLWALARRGPKSVLGKPR
ncbi:hypothetical protein V5O48_001063 [Marasmius crinis-equi]|uniref:Uncharacterized protein n=1 Tax=Marasmius crinis-equi TaxID=585013 RepID=A0ABR3FZK4_9AGAR